jgi:hypothetical protein
MPRLKHMFINTRCRASSSLRHHGSFVSSHASASSMSFRHKYADSPVRMPTSVRLRPIPMVKSPSLSAWVETHALGADDGAPVTAVPVRLEALALVPLQLIEQLFPVHGSLPLAVRKQLCVERRVAHQFPQPEISRSNVLN